MCVVRINIQTFPRNQQKWQEVGHVPRVGKYFIRPIIIIIQQLLIINYSYIYKHKFIIYI
jgi:hypothetical protein